MVGRGGLPERDNFLEVARIAVCAAGSTCMRNYWNGPYDQVKLLNTRYGERRVGGPPIVYVCPTAAFRWSDRSSSGKQVRT